MQSVIKTKKLLRKKQGAESRDDKHKSNGVQTHWDTVNLTHNLYLAL